MTYELTRYGEEYLETGSKRLEKRREELEQKSTTGKKYPYDSTMYKLNRRLEILGNVSRGQDPVGSFEFLPSHWKKRKEAAYSSMRKEVASMLKDNLIRETSTTSTRELKEVPGWEQKIQYDLGRRGAGSITASQEEYEKPSPLGMRDRHLLGGDKYV